MARSSTAWSREEQQVGFSLVVPFIVVTCCEFGDGAPQRGLAEHDQFGQALAFDGAYPSLGKGIQVRRLRRELHGPNANSSKNALKFRREQRVAIVDQIALAIQNSVLGIGHISADMTHPQSVRMGCYASDFHPASRQIDKEQDEEALQASSGPDLHAEEVCGYDQFPVSCQKLLPSRLSIPFWCRFDPVPTENISDRAARQLVSEIGYGPWMRR
jgi:hypothetical protein